MIDERPADDDDDAGNVLGYQRRSRAFRAIWKNLAL